MLSRSVETKACLCCVADLAEGSSNGRRPRRRLCARVCYFSFRRAGGLNEAHPAVFRVLRIRPPGQDANLVFKKPSLTAFLEDLAGCQAVIANSGFSLISEAL
ncbi:MAG: hypothetical protein DMG69_28655 [Acidobacteria bacterium]|nr:MAG: hypothetical protein DMG69_28655 [Acidobacteriota bacterium]